MNKKHRIKAILFSCIFALSITACTKDKDSNQTGNNTQSTSSQNASSDNIGASITEAPVPEFVDEDGNFVTQIVVTSDGVALTDAQGSEQTEYVIVDIDNNILKDNNGEPIKPSVPVVTSTASATENKKSVGCLWISNQVNNNKIIGLPGEDGNLVEYKFKVNENAPAGNYKITLSASGSSFADYNGDAVTPVYQSGTISVGEVEVPAENKPSSDTTHVYITNASANPGETITVYAAIRNNKEGMAGIVLRVDYNSDIFTLESLQRTGIIESIGDFSS